MYTYNTDNLINILLPKHNNYYCTCLAAIYNKTKLMRAYIKMNRFNISSEVYFSTLYKLGMNSVLFLSIYFINQLYGNKVNKKKIKFRY